MEKTVVITGSNRGIGKAILEEFAKAGYNVWACSRSLSFENEMFYKTMELENDIWIKPVIFDMLDLEAVKLAAKQINKDKIPINAIINNAGILGEPKLFSMTSIDEIKTQFDVNFFHPMLFTQILLKNMMRYKNGSIVNMSSVSGLDGYGIQFGYVSSKAALIGATKKLARELTAFNIRVNAIAPGIVDTDMAAMMTDEQKKEVCDKITMKRSANPLEIAKTALFLVSENSSYITGQVIRVDGGM